MNKTCFVISPIGDKGSEVRTRADALYDLIIEPALEKFSFDVTRADKGTSVSSITSEIIQLVQDSGLCIIDITGHNPNVMYECGRRHETAKPYVMVAQEGERLPFDINTIRTVFYNLNDAREIRNTVKTLQGIIEKMLESGLEPERSGESLSSLSDTLARIERKIDRFSITGSPRMVASTGTGVPEYQDILSSLGLFDALAYSFAQSDVGLMEFLMPHAERQFPHEKFIELLSTAVSMGSFQAHRKLWDGFGAIDTYERDLQKSYIASLVAGCNMQDREEDGLALMDDFFKKMKEAESPSPELTNQDKAFFLNQYARLLHGLNRIDDALEVAKEVLRISPDDLSYHYNYSILCESAGDYDSAYDAAKKLYILMKQANSYDDDHLSRVVELLEARKDTISQEAFAKLQEVNPYKATLLLRKKALKIPFRTTQPEDN